MKPLQPRLAMPSMRNTRIGKVRNRTGQALNGAIARAETAPAVNAIDRRRQPQARTMLWTRLFNVTVNGRGLGRDLDWSGRPRRVASRRGALPPATPPRADLPVGD